MHQTIALLLLTAAEHAEHAAEGAHGGHGGGGWDWYTLGGQWFNFFVVFGAIAWLVRSRIKATLEARRSAMAVQLEEARAKQEEAEKRLSEFGNKLDHLEDEVQRIVKSFEEQGEADRGRIKLDADKAIERLVKEADFTINQEKAKAQREIREAGVRTTLLLAEKLIQERITDADRRRLADEYVRQVSPTSSSVMPQKGEAS